MTDSAALKKIGFSNSTDLGQVVVVQQVVEGSAGGGGAVPALQAARPQLLALLPALHARRPAPLHHRVVLALRTARRTLTAHEVVAPVKAERI